MELPEICNCEQSLGLKDQVISLQNEVSTLRHFLNKARKELREAERVRDAWKMVSNFGGS